jgi:hypothetical protein
MCMAIEQRRCNLASPHTVAHSLKLNVVVIMTLVLSYPIGRSGGVSGHSSLIRLLTPVCRRSAAGQRPFWSAV